MQNIENIAQQYNPSDDFDTHLTKQSGIIIAPRINGKNVLEMGCLDGYMTGMLLKSANSVEIVEGSEIFVKNIRTLYKDSVTVYHSLFERFNPDKYYDAIVLAHVLHHMHDPESLLNRIKTWLVPQSGRLYITVPNMLSLHRQIGVKMGLLKDVFDSSERNIKFDQPGRYTKEKLIRQIKSCGFHVVECFNFFLKPFSNEQMKALKPSKELIVALFEIGKQFEEIACHIFLEAAP